MISQTAEYALRAVVFLAEHTNRPYTIQEIARATRIPKQYLYKVLQNLVARDFIGSQRGLHGGFQLAVLPEQLTVYEILQAVDPLQRITRCPVGNPCHAQQLCPLHRRLDETMALVEQAFHNSCIADLLTTPTTETEISKHASLLTSLTA